MSVPTSMITAWKRSIPVDRRISGISAEGRRTLEAIHMLDAQVRVMWDKKRRVVTLWRIFDDGTPCIIADSPFTPLVDCRTFLWLADGDTRGYAGIGDYIEQKVDAPNRKSEEDHKKESFGKVDHDKAWWAAKKAKASMTGNPMGIFSGPSCKSAQE